MVVIFAAGSCYVQMAADERPQNDPWGKHHRAIEFDGVPSFAASADGDNARLLTVAAADFDGKNGPDVLTVQSDGMLNLLRNQGNEKLELDYHNDSAVGLKPNVTYIEESDLNGDCYPDVVALDSKNNAMLVFLNNADGTFSSATSIPVQAENGASFAGGGFTIADTNADGNPDLIAVARGSQAGTTIFVQQTFLGTGNGTFELFASRVTSLPGERLLTAGHSLAADDMNRDGKLDLVLQIYQSAAQSMYIAVSPGREDGSFENIPETGASVSAGPQPASSLALADVNRDGVPDAVFLTYSDRVYVAPGQPGGTLGEPAPVLSNMSGAVLLTLGDLNQDGTLDLIVFGSGELGIFSGQGDGTFKPAAQYAGGYGIYQQPVPRDFDGDGRPDLAWLDYTNGRVGVYFSSAHGGFKAAEPVRPMEKDGDEWAGNIQAITAADLNGDGTRDVLAYDWPHASAGGPADLYSGINNGRGQFHFRPALPPGRLQELAGHYGSLVIDSSTGDFNNDGRADIILRTQLGLSVLLAGPGGVLRPNAIDVDFPVPVGCMPFSYVTTGDVNGDGKLDIAAGYLQNKNCNTSASTPSGFFVLLGDGTGHFRASFTPFGDAVFFVRLADLNGDHRLDLITANLVPDRGFTVYSIPGNGNGTFETTAAMISVRDQFISNILVGDYNGDQKADLVLSTDGAAGDDGAPEADTQGLLLLPGYGDFTFGRSNLILQGIRSIWNGTASGDFNNDGKPDVAVSTYAKAEPYRGNFGLIVLPNQGNGNFGLPHAELTPLNVTGRNAVVFVSDFNGDRRPDVLLGSGLSSPLFLNTRRTVMPY